MVASVQGTRRSRAVARLEQAGSAATTGPGRAAAGALGRFAAWCRAAAERRRQRHFLATLDAHGLRDIGLTRAQALRECCKFFWQA
ncbi:MAG: DUF1127 domain-containing protein [Alphaproteobacteria bacterium]|nr:DUF1127 domain-containing protein [Alphaproteobacteria bacterium]